MLAAVIARARALGTTAGSALKELSRIPGESARHRPHPPQDGLVLDVGGGQSAHPRADVVVDKYVVDDFERAGPLELTKPLIVADGHRLPFADATFSYVVAMHVLEHATDPVQFAAELMRVAAAGFVQLPSAESELTFGWPFHPWLVDREGDTLVFRPKGERRAHVGTVFHESYEQSVLMRLWWASNRSRWHHSVEWRGRLDVRVEGESEADQTAALDVERTLGALEQLRELGRLTPLPAHVSATLRCPLCRSSLTEEPSRLVCAECGSAYPVVGDVPVLLEEAVRV
jgi:methyltransferase family protein/18S rRNA m6A1832 methyltransferase subunit Trm112p-like protein